MKQSIASMNKEEFEAWKVQRAANVAARAKERADRKARLESGLANGQRILIDLEFSNLMTEAENQSMAHQVSFCYSANAKAPTPCHLILSGFEGDTKEYMDKHVAGHGQWMVSRTEKTYLEQFGSGDEKNHLVYLSADAPEELQELDPSKIYIVGGIVDRNRHKGLCQGKAEGQGIATARLPLADYIALASSQVMCTNHVVEIMIKWLELKDWGEAFKAVVPTRKRKERGDREGGSGGDSGGGERKRDGQAVK